MKIKPPNVPLQISWIRLSDYRILTNGLITFTADDRFSVLHNPDGNEWTLQISGVQSRDQGVYQCQAATATGIRTISTMLKVHRPKASILLNGNIVVGPTWVTYTGYSV